MNAREQGLYPKFNVTRTDGRDAPGEKHHGAEYFVLNMSTDPHAIPALSAYAEACREEYPALAADLSRTIGKKVLADSEYITVPDVTLPGGRFAPSFRVGKFISSRGPGDIPVSIASGKPWVEISYHDARKAAGQAQLAVLTETQALAIAWDISQQDINWTGGKVGEGDLFQGLRNGAIDEAQPGSYEPENPAERRWHQLSNGERIYDFAGNAYTWIFDDVQGDENGLTTIIKVDSISLTTAPYPSRQNGMGYRPDGERDWSGSALFRGGCWFSESNAGAFYLNRGWPGFAIGSVGFRCTQPGL